MDDKSYKKYSKLHVKLTFSTSLVEMAENDLEYAKL